MYDIVKETYTSINYERDGEYIMCSNKELLQRSENNTSIDKKIEIGDYVVCIETCSPIIKDEIIKVKDINYNNKDFILYNLYGYNGLLFKAECFKFYDYYNTPYTDGTYPKRNKDEVLINV